MEAHEYKRVAKTVRVLVVDDSPTARLMLCRMLEVDPLIKVVGTANNGREAMDQVGLVEPDLVTMDVNMPVMDGIVAIEQIMAYHPVPILVVSSTIEREHTANAARALGAGAVDVICKPQPTSVEEFKNVSSDLRAKVKLLSRVKVITHPRAKLVSRLQVVQGRADHLAKLSPAKEMIVAIGSSTGGPQALQRILGSLPADINAGIVIVQHIAAGFTDGLVDWLAGSCRIKVSKGRNGQKVEKGEAIIAPDGIHMIVTPGRRIQLVEVQIASPHKPAADVLLESVANVYGENGVGVILTGMGRDGALGIKSMHDRGGHTIAQDKDSSVIFSMAKEAIRLGGVENVAPVTDISRLIMQFTK
ncbi:MAG: chemotaxis-specific protein-glutamate methyltransferase CheB [Thermoleophilia bacterium]